MYKSIKMHITTYPVCWNKIEIKYRIIIYSTDIFERPIQNKKIYKSVKNNKNLNKK